MKLPVFDFDHVCSGRSWSSVKPLETEIEDTEQAHSPFQ